MGRNREERIANHTTRRWRRMKKRLAEDGGELTFKSYGEFYDWVRTKMEALNEAQKRSEEKCLERF